MMEFLLGLLLGLMIGMALTRWLWYLGERMSDEAHLYRGTQGD